MYVCKYRQPEPETYMCYLYPLLSHLDDLVAVLTVALISGLAAIVLLLLVAIVVGFVCCSR